MMQIFRPHVKLLLPVMVVLFVVSVNSFSQEVALKMSYEEYVQKADSLVFNSNYGQSLEPYDSALSKLEGQNDIGIRVVVLQKKSHALMNLNRVQDAEIALNESLNLGMQHFGEFSEQVSTTYYFMGKNLSNQRNRFDEALEHLESSLKIRKTLSSERRELVAESLTMIGVIHMYSSKFDLAIDDYEKALEIWNTLPERTLPSERSRTYFGIGWINIALGQPVQALEALNESLRLNKETFNVGHGRISNDLNLIGRAYSDLGQFDNALRTLEQTLKIRIKNFGEDHPNVAGTYRTMANLFFLKGESTSAIDYTLQAIRILEENYQKENSALIALYSNLAQYYRSTMAYGKQGQALEKALEVARFSGENNASLLPLYLNLTQRAVSLKNWAEFDSNIDKSLRLASKLYGENHPNFGTALRIKAMGLSEQGQKLDALQLALKSRKIFKERLSPASQNQVNGDFLVARMYDDINNTDSALYYADKAINLAASNGASEDEFQDDFTEVNLPHLLTNALQLKSDLYIKKYETDEELINLKNALEFSLKAISLLESTRNRLVSSQVGEELFVLAETVYVKAMSTSFMLYDILKETHYKEVAFDISERSKGFVFLKTLSQKQSLSYGNVPDSLLQQALDFKSQIRYYSRLRLNAGIRKQEKQQQKYERLIFDLRGAYQSLVKQIEQLYPDFYGMKYKPEVLSLQEAKDGLGKTSKAVVEFTVDQTEIFSQIITADTSLFIRTPKPDNFDLMLNEFRKSYSDYTFLANDKADSDSLFTTHGYDLYKLLIAPAMDGIAKESEVIIVAHGELYDVSFELMLTESIGKDFSYSSLPYLAKKWAITYASSLSIHQRLEQISYATPRKNFGGFATDLSFTADVAQNRTDFAQRGPGNEAIATIREVESISNLLGGDSFVQELATEENFRNTTNSYNVVHLAMHGSVDNVNPFNSALVFSPGNGSEEDGLLTLDEIHALDLRSNMVVLSACNTGFNTGVISGEGMVSMSRGFMFSGVPSIVMSLWTIPDEATADIMLDFYKYLESGVNKPVALQKAKLDYLNKVEDDFYAHPYFWGGMSHMGNTEPLQLSKAKPWYLIWVLSALIIVVLLRLRARKNV